MDCYSCWIKSFCTVFQECHHVRDTFEEVDWSIATGTSSFVLHNPLNVKNNNSFKNLIARTPKNQRSANLKASALLIYVHLTQNPSPSFSTLKIPFRRRDTEERHSTNLIFMSCSLVVCWVRFNYPCQYILSRLNCSLFWEHLWCSLLCLQTLRTKRLL